MAFKIAMTVDFSMAYTLMFVSMTLTFSFENVCKARPTYFVVLLSLIGIISFSLAVMINKSKHAKEIKAHKMLI